MMAIPPVIYVEKKKERGKKTHNICRESTSRKTNHEFNLKSNFALGVKAHVEAFTSR